MSTSTKGEEPMANPWKAMKATYIEVSAGVRYWEDATVNGTEDADGTLIPARKGDTWAPAFRPAKRKTCTSACTQCQSRWKDRGDLMSTKTQMLTRLCWKP
jgi:hypothetical protein